MSTSVISKEHGPRPASGLPPDPTLADVLQQLDRCPDLSPRQRADLRSAVISVARVLDLPLAGTPARLDLLRPQLSQVLPAAHGLDPSELEHGALAVRQSVAAIGSPGPARP